MSFPNKVENSSFFQGGWSVPSDKAWLPASSVSFSQWPQLDPVISDSLRNGYRNQEGDSSASSETKMVLISTKTSSAPNSSGSNIREKEGSISKTKGVIASLEKAKHTSLHSSSLNSQSRRGFFNYQQVFRKSLEEGVGPFESIIEKERYYSESRNFFHAPARLFIQHNLTILKKSLEEQKILQDRISMQFDRFFRSYRKCSEEQRVMQNEPKKERISKSRILCLEEMIEDLIEEIPEAINKEDKGLNFCQAQLQLHLDRSASFLQAAEDLRKRDISIVSCPSICGGGSFDFRRYKGGRTNLSQKDLDIPAEALAAFYTNYVKVIGWHQTYFQEAISAHEELLEHVQALFKEHRSQ